MLVVDLASASESRSIWVCAQLLHQHMYTLAVALNGICPSCWPGDVPAIGQAVSGMSTGLGQVNGVLGGAGSSVRELVRRTGVKGLDAGLGCGVGVGYGFGAGLFLKPSATEYLVQLVKDVTGKSSPFACAQLAILSS